MLAATVTHVGNIRTNNEDLAFVGSRLFALADGMGGPPAGELASDLMIAALHVLDEFTPATGEEALDVLAAAVDAGNEAIAESGEDESRTGLGTTVTALLAAADGTLALMHVGDSRAYLLRGGELGQITRDDTYVQFLVDRGALDAADVRDHPQKALVMQAMQGGPYEPQCAVLHPHPGDRFLLCSDGLSDIVTDDSIATAMLANPDPTTCCVRLITLALNAGAPDNVTVVVLDIG